MLVEQLQLFTRVEVRIILVRASRPKEPTAPEFIRSWVNCGASLRASQYLNLGKQGPGRLEDVETRQVISFIPDLGREEYLKRREEHVVKLKKACGAWGIDYLQLDTGQPLDFALYEYLSTRRKSM
jgi:uncharacterized protein (DUF58 family)